MRSKVNLVFTKEKILMSTGNHQFRCLCSVVQCRPILFMYYIRIDKNFWSNMIKVSTNRVTIVCRRWQVLLFFLIADDFTKLVSTLSPLKLSVNAIILVNYLYHNWQVSFVKENRCSGYYWCCILFRGWDVSLCGTMWHIVWCGTLCSNGLN